MTAAQRRGAFLIGAVLLVSYGYFNQGGGWSQNTRLDVARAVTGHATLQIDAMATNTGDRAEFNGHLYSDKPPGQPLLSLPAVALTRPVLQALDIDPSSEAGTSAMGWAATVTSSGIPAAVAAMVLFWICLALGSSTTASAVAALAFGLATPTWAYATLLWAHSLATACLLMAFAATIALSRSHERQERALALGLGLAAGWAVITDFPVAPAAAIIVVAAVVMAEPSHRRRLVVFVGAGCAIPLGVVLANNALSFGSPFRLGYANETGFDRLQEGFMGVTWPHPDVLASLLIGPSRGLLLIAPVLIVAPAGLVILARRRDTQPLAIAAGAIAGYFLLYNAAYAYWSGGWSFGPRHLASGIPFLCIGLAPLWDLGRRRWRIAVIGLAAFGAVVCLAAVATTPQPPDQFRSPVTDLVLPAIRHGQVALGSQSYLEAQPEPPVSPRRTGDDATNVGLVLGLTGLWSVLPLVGIWAVFAGVAARSARPRHAVPGPPRPAAGSGAHTEVMA